MRDMNTTTKGAAPRTQAEWDEHGVPEVPGLRDPGRYFPDPVFLHAPEHRPVDDPASDRWEVKRADNGRWETVHPICIDIIRGLERGLGFDAMVSSLPHYPAENLTNKATKKRVARKYVWKLHRLGHVRLDLDEPPGRFHGRYTRVKELGRGGLGIAHLCTDDAEGGREVVVKHPWGVKARIMSGQKAVAMEIQVLQETDHPSYPELHDHFTDEHGLLHMVRTFVDGTKLSRAAYDRLDDRPWRLDMARQVADALGHLHDRGYLFFDPSPDNFFVLDDGRVVVSDVGGARAHHEGRIKVKGPRGTAGYVAPDMRAGGEDGVRWASVASDVYSFGALYYHLTVGRRAKRLWRHGELVADLKARGVDARDLEIVDRCCRDAPEARPADMGAVRDLLR